MSVFLGDIWEKNRQHRGRQTLTGAAEAKGLYRGSAMDRFCDSVIAKGNQAWPGLRYAQGDEPRRTNGELQRIDFSLKGGVRSLDYSKFNLQLSRGQPAPTI